MCGAASRVSGGGALGGAAVVVVVIAGGGGNRRRRSPVRESSTSVTVLPASASNLPPMGASLPDSLSSQVGNNLANRCSSAPALHASHSDRYE